MRLMLLALALGLCPAQAFAFDVSELKALAPILSPDPDAKICLQRRYDSKHLRAHPAQKVTRLTLFLHVQGYRNQGEAFTANPDYIFYHFALAGRRRADRKTLTATGDCYGVGVARCAVDCDGGGVTLEKSADGASVALKLDERGLDFRGDCETTLATFTSGTDDKVFVLEPAPAKACDALERLIHVP
jgi:hypothetical protein